MIENFDQKKKSNKKLPFFSELGFYVRILEFRGLGRPTKYESKIYQNTGA